MYNYGIPGAGLGPTLALTTTRNWRGEITESSGTVLYFFFDFDVHRIIPTFSQGSLDHMKDQVFLEENVQQKVVTVSPYRWDKALILFFYRLLGNSKIIRHFNIDFPMPSNRDLRLFAKALKEMQSSLQKVLKVDRFIVVSHPGGSSAYFRYLRTYLENEGIASIDFSQWRLEDLVTERPSFVCDGHSTASVNTIMAQALAKVLKPSPPPQINI